MGHLTPYNLPNMDLIGTNSALSTLKKKKKKKRKVPK